MSRDNCWIVKPALTWAILTATMAISSSALAFELRLPWSSKSQASPPPADAGGVRPEPKTAESGRAGTDMVRVSAKQAAEFKLGPVQERVFHVRRQAIGVIDFNQDRNVSVFSPYQGRIGQIPVKAGDDVRAGQLLFTVSIPDLPQACSTLISAAASLKVTTETLNRARALVQTQSIPEKELQQNLADQQTAEAAYKAARQALALFGLKAGDIDEIESQRAVRSEMPVFSPFDGRVVTRSAAVGLLVQPGAGNPVVTVADMRNLWMLASVPESEFGFYKLGQTLSVTVPAYPGRSFEARVNYLGDSVDPTTRRIVVRADVANRQQLLRPQMSASFTIEVAAPMKSPAVPETALARENDGTMSVWASDDGILFKRRTVSIGLIQDGMAQILSGLRPGERIAQQKALFLSNLYLISVN